MPSKHCCPKLASRPGYTGFSSRTRSPVAAYIELRADLFAAEPNRFLPPPRYLRNLGYPTHWLNGVINAILTCKITTNA